MLRRNSASSGLTLTVQATDPLPESTAVTVASPSMAKTRPLSATTGDMT